MFFVVDAASPVGLADQLAAQIRGALADGRLRPGEKLPPARQVAAGLDVNMHTVLRAYAMVRDEGLIELRRGRGAQVVDDLDPDRLRLDTEIRALAATALRLGVGQDELVDRVRRAMRGVQAT